MGSMTPHEDTTSRRHDSDQATLRGLSTSQSRESRRSVDNNRPPTSQSGSAGRASISSGLRHRHSTRRQAQQSQLQQSYTSGRDQNGRQIFTLAGPSLQDDDNNGRTHNQSINQISSSTCSSQPSPSSPSSSPSRAQTTLESPALDPNGGGSSPTPFKVRQQRGRLHQRCVQGLEG